MNQYLVLNEQCLEFNKVGDPKDNIRRDVRSIMQLLCALYSNAKIFNYIVEGLKSKNAKQRTGQCHRECRCMYVQEFTSAKAAVRRNVFSSNRPFWISTIIGRFIGHSSEGCLYSCWKAAINPCMICVDGTRSVPRRQEVSRRQ